MKRYECRLAYCVFGTIALTLPLHASHIANIVPTAVGPSASGTFTYSYLVQNSSSSIDDIFAFGLAGLTDPLTSILTPTGWDVEVTTAAITWTSLDPTFDIPPGASMSGFGFQSSVPPGSVTSATFGSERITGVPTDAQSTITIGPAVPEASTLSLVAIGLGMCINLPSRFKRLYVVTLSDDAVARCSILLGAVIAKTRPPDLLQLGFAIASVLILWDRRIFARFSKSV